MSFREVRIAGSWLAAAASCCFVTGCQSTGPRGPDRPNDRPEAVNMRLVGHTDLQARSAYQPVIIEQNGRWIAYVGHHGGKAVNPLTGAVEPNGTSIVDVTDPARPKYLAHIPGEQGEGEAGGAQMARVCNGRDLPRGDHARTYLLRTFGTSAQEIWDVTAPERPLLLTTVEKGLRDTHKNSWECDTGIAYLVSGVRDWRVRRIIQIWDLSDPKKPAHVRGFSLPGHQAGTSGPMDSFLHGLVSTGPKGNRVYVAYGTNRDGVVQILDRRKLLEGPREPVAENLLYPQVGRLNMPVFIGAHTTLPVTGVPVPEFARDERGGTRDFVFVVNEAFRLECTGEVRNLVYVLDVTDEKNPFPVANYQVAEASGNFCTRGGRFGSHASNENQPAMYAKRILFFSWFNAGVRAVDIRDPYRPSEIGYYIPAVTDKTDKRCVKTAEGERCKIAIQTNNVEVDDRGYIYIVDRANTGMHVLELTGPARAIADFK
jgi:hypothetical protein